MEGEDLASTQRLRRIVALTFVITALAAAFQPANAAGASAYHPAGFAMRMAGVVATNSSTAAAIQSITAPTTPPDVLSRIPAGFSRVMGYTPAIGYLANGQPVAINPRGGCSVIGGGRPFDLDVPCKAHDLGYDLLRYAHREGADLAPTARQEVDAKFSANLDAQCIALYRGNESDACEVMAASFDAGVGFNSWRQEFGAPTAQAGMVRTIGVLGLAGFLLYLLGRSMVRAVGRALVRRRILVSLDAAAA